MPSRSILAALLTFGLVAHANAANAQDAKPATSQALAGTPFDSASLAAAMKGLRAFSAKMADAGSVTAAVTAARKNLAALQAKKDPSVQNYLSSRQSIAKCASAFNGTKSTDRAAQLQRKMLAVRADQNALDKLSVDYYHLRLSLDSATARHDSAAVQRVNDEISALLSVDAAADSAATVAKCGVLPPKPPALQQLDSAQAALDAATRQLMSAEASADSAGARAAGVNVSRFSQMRARLAQFLAGNAAFTGREADLLKARKSEFGALITGS